MKNGHIILFCTLLIAMSSIFAGCSRPSHFINRGDSATSRWFKKEVSRVATNASKVKESSKLNYQVQFSVHVAEKKDRGGEHNAEERSSLPDLILHVTLPDMQVIKIGDQPNSYTIMAEYPMSIKTGESIDVRLVDKKGSYLKVRYDNRYTDDQEVTASTEVPLAQFNFLFEGPGRYMFHSGYGVFFVDFRIIK